MSSGGAASISCLIHSSALAASSGIGRTGKKRRKSAEGWGTMIFTAPHARIVLAALATQSSSANSANSGNPAVWIALAALLVSIALPLYLDSRQRPRVRVQISTLAVISGEDDRRYYQVSAINHGRSPVTINRMDLIYWTKAEKIDIHLGLPQQKFSYGESLPKELSPYANISFGVLQDDVHQMIGNLMAFGCVVRCLSQMDSRCFPDGHCASIRNRNHPTNHSGWRT